MESLAPGDHVDRYRIERLVGRGGMGEVFEATHTLLQKRVAIKVLADHLSRDAEIARRFLREGRNASRVEHPNVVRVLDGGIVDGRPFIAMEYLDGAPLSTLTRLGPMSPVQALAVTLPIAHALWWGHELGVIHRDVKPANIFLAPDPWQQQKAILLDFGISKRPDSSTNSVTPVIDDDDTGIGSQNESLRGEGATEGAAAPGSAAMIRSGMSGEILFRAMFPDDDGGPRVGSQRNMLGIRPGVDVKQEPAGPGRGGMSVTARNAAKMPAPIRPKAFGGLNGETVMFELDEGSLEPPGLQLGTIHPRSLHAVVEANEMCSISELQERLHSTRGDWRRCAPRKEVE